MDYPEHSPTNLKDAQQAELGHALPRVGVHYVTGYLLDAVLDHAQWDHDRVQLTTIQVLPPKTEKRAT